MPTTGKLYLGSTLLSDAEAYRRPLDWLELPAAAAGTVRGLHAVFNNATNFVAFRMQTSNGAAYTVDWGDGTTSTISSNAIAQRNFNWNNVSASTLTSEGYRQVIVTITPPSGASFTYANFGEKYSTGVTIPTAVRYSTGWLDMSINLPGLTTGQRLLIGTSSVRHGLIQRINILSWGAITTAQSLFTGCAGLEEVNSAEWNTSAITNFDSMFFECSSLQFLDASTWDTSKVTSFGSMFRGCPSLSEVKCSNWNTSSLWNMANFALGCYALVKIDVSGWNVSGVSSLLNAFNSCYSLQKLDLGNWTLNSLSTASGCFTGCWSLHDIGVQSITIPVATNLNNLFQNCYNLQSIGTINIPSSASTTSICADCHSLKSAGFVGINTTTSFANCMLSAAELNTIYTNLSTTGTGKTITVTGNYGTTSDDPSIAEAKGWTVAS